jgi:TolB protein
VVSSADPGTIAYVRGATNQIRLIQPDGTNDRVLWTSPDTTTAIYDLEWRPDGAMLAFSSEHEHACSWYDSDVYSILANGAGLRRVTNSPDCAGLATYPQGQVIVTVNGVMASGWVSVYVQGSTELKGTLVSPGSSTQLTFDRVADLGPGVEQPAVAIYGIYRFLCDPPAPDVQAGQTAYATVWIGATQTDGLGAGPLSWRSDGSRIAYAMRDYSAAYQIAANPPAGAVGGFLPTLTDFQASLVDWAPTASQADQFLYNVPWDGFVEGVRGIYLTSTAQTGGGTQLVATSGTASPLYQQFGYDPAGVWDLKWLPDGSGFLFIETYVYVNLDDPDAACMGLCSDVFKYDLTTGTVTQVTRLGAGHEDDTARSLSISPDGQYVAIQRITEDAGDPLNTSSAIWVVGLDGSGLRQLVSDGWAVAWGRTAPEANFHVSLPLVTR